MISTIKTIRESDKYKGSYYGFIKSTDDGKDYYFAKKDINFLPIEELEIGIEVEFQPIDIDGKRSAEDITIISKKTNTTEAKVLQTPQVIPEKILKKPPHTFESYRNKIIDDIALIEGVKNPDDFEDMVHLIFQLLGIHDSYQFDRNNQAGKADGFFMLNTLAVMYDCTLHSQFEDFKKEQIDNYTNKLSQKSQITFDIRKPDGISSKTLQILGKQRQVWIITYGKSRELYDYDGIKVKEISVKSLVDLLTKRLKAGTYESDRLTMDLALLGS